MMQAMRKCTQFHMQMTRLLITHSDQPAGPCNLVSTYVVCYLQCKCINTLFSIHKLVSMHAQLKQLVLPEDTFSHEMARL